MAKSSSNTRTLTKLIARIEPIERRLELQDG
jgi:hypothetical protein